MITGIEYLAADLTPTGTYRIFAKQRNVFLSGSDTIGSWRVWVYFWMPFLTNQYGTYGLHDATWRRRSDFGAVSPFSSNASRGCVELPLAAARWLYGWVRIGTKVVVFA